MTAATAGRAVVEWDSPSVDRSERRGDAPPDGARALDRTGRGGAAVARPRQPGGQDGRVPSAPPIPESSLGRRTRRSRRPEWAQTRRSFRHFNVWSVAKVSLVFYLLVLVAVVVASVMMWYIANAFGAIQSIEKSVRTLFDLSKFTLHPSEVATYTSIGGAIVAVGGTLANILIACMYNLISDIVGGIRFDVVEDTIVEDKVLDR